MGVCYAVHNVIHQARLLWYVQVYFRYIFLYLSYILATVLVGTFLPRPTSSWHSVYLRVNHHATLYKVPCWQAFAIVIVLMFCYFQDTFNRNREWWSRHLRCRHPHPCVSLWPKLSGNHARRHVSLIRPIIPSHRHGHSAWHYPLNLRSLPPTQD